MKTSTFSHGSVLVQGFFQAVEVYEFFSSVDSALKFVKEAQLFDWTVETTDGHILAEAEYEMFGEYTDEEDCVVDDVLYDHETYDISALYEDVKPEPKPAFTRSTCLPTHKVSVVYTANNKLEVAVCKTTKAAWEFIQQENSEAAKYRVYGPNGYMQYNYDTNTCSEVFEYDEKSYEDYLSYVEQFRYLDSHEMVVEYETSEGTEYAIKYGMQAAANFAADKGECFINTPQGFYCYGFKKVNQYQLFDYDANDEGHSYEEILRLAAH